MTLDEYLANIDESDPNTTAAIHIAEVCRHAAGCRLILELGTHQGISTAGIALAAPGAEIAAVDWCHNSVAAARVEFWRSLGVPAGAIKQINAEVGQFLRDLVQAGGKCDLVFHDASHGDAVIEEYLNCAVIARIVAIHDFELLSPENRRRVEAVLSPLHESADHKGRVLFVGESK